MRVLTLRELNRTLLLRQLLLRRERLSATRAIERVAALQAQWVPSPYVALWSRLEGFERDALTRALTRGHALKASLMRGTLHLVSSRDFPLYDAALRRDPAPWTTGRPKPPPELVRATASFARQPRSGAELRAFIVERRGPGTDEENHRDLNWLRHLIPLVPQPESGAWGFVRGVRLRAYDGVRPRREEALEHLVRRYLAAFGPATRADLAAWSGQVLKTLDTALDRLRLRRFLDEEGRELLDLPRAPLAEPDVQAPVRLLSRWDELLIGHAHRRRVIPEEHEHRKLMLSGDPTLLVDGFVAGTWKVDRGRVIVEPFASLPRTVRREVEDESRRLAAFLG
jgi:winged helix DNA-binding protein